VIDQARITSNKLSLPSETPSVTERAASRRRQTDHLLLLCPAHHLLAHTNKVRATIFFLWHSSCLVLSFLLAGLATPPQQRENRLGFSFSSLGSLANPTGYVVFLSPLVWLPPTPPTHPLASTHTYKTLSPTSHPPDTRPRVRVHSSPFSQELSRSHDTCCSAELQSGESCPLT
jgi:hypothetical protein